MPKKFQKPEREERTYNTKPPIAEEFLVKILKRWRMKHKSEYVPNEYLVAATWWIEHQEPQRPGEMPVATSDSKGNQSWTTPHIERVTASLRVFLRFSEPEKAFVIHHIERGIPYRGDPINFYKEVAKNTQVRDEYIEKYGRTHDGKLPLEYTQMVGKAMRRQLRKMTTPTPETTE